MRSLLILFISFCMLPVLANNTNVNIFDIADHLSSTQNPKISHKTIINKALILKIYKQNKYQLIWPNDYINEAIEILKSSHKDGLLKKDYHYFKLVELTNLYNKTSPEKNKLRAEMDALLTDGMITYQFHLINGKVVPEHLYKTWNYHKVSLKDSRIIARLQKSIKQRTLKDDIDQLRPQFPWYARLQNQLEWYRQLSINYPDNKLAMVETLSPGQSSRVMPGVIEKLEQVNLVKKQSRTDPTRYTADLVNPIKKYQRLHGLSVDGVIGPNTINNMNVPYRDRVNQIKANLERGRWLSDDLTENYLLVNIAGFKLFYFQNNRPVWETEVIVGKQWKKTPVFTAKLKYIDFNPTWTVPKSMAPPIIKKIQNNPDYFTSRGFSLKNASGKAINTANFNWKSQDPDNFHYWLVQKPSSRNPLGRVKFMLPNEHAIYLHDTPSKWLFSKSKRLYSSGCIRINESLQLSLKLLQHDQNFDEYEQERILEEGKTKSIFLKHPIEVFIMYWTASPEPDGFYFYTDIYNRDKALIKQINTPFENLLRGETHYL